jgi:hypothetical protein
MLKRDPQSRIKAHELLKITESELSAMLRFREEGTHMSPSEEIRQLTKFLPEQHTLELLPVAQRRELLSRITELSKEKGLTVEETRHLDEIISSRLPVNEHG